MAAQHKSREGSWVVIAPGTTILENSELRALRKAVALGGQVKFVKWGQRIDDAPVLSEADASTDDGEGTDE